MEYEPFEISEARIKFGNSSWEGFKKVPTPTQSELDNRFTYHAPKEGQNEKYQALRVKAKELAEMACDLVPFSREQSLALTALEEFVFWSNAGIARNE